MTNTIDKIIEIAKASGMQSIVVRNLLHREANTDLLSEFVESGVKSWDDYIWSGDYGSITKETFSKLSRPAKNKVMDTYAEKRAYIEMLKLVDEEAKTRPDLLIEGSKYLEEQTASGKEATHDGKGLLSVYLAYLSGDKKRLEQSVKKQYEHAMKGEYTDFVGRSAYCSSGGWWCRDDNLRFELFGRHSMEDLADLFERAEFKEEAKNVRTRMLEYLDTPIGHDHSHSQNVKQPGKTLQQILAGKGEAGNNPMHDSTTLELYLHTAKKLGYAKELHPRGIELFLAKHIDDGYNFDNILKVLYAIRKEEADCSENQMQRLKDLILKVYLKDAHSSSDDSKRMVASNYETLRELFKDNENVLDQLALANLPLVAEEQQEILLSEIKTAEGRYKALTYLVNNKLWNELLVSPEKIARFVVDGVTTQNKDLVQLIIHRYEHEKDISYAETFARSVGMTERAEAYQQMKELVRLKNDHQC